MTSLNHVDAIADSGCSSTRGGVWGTLYRTSRSWRAKPPAEKALIPVAFVLLGASRAALAAVPFRRIAPLLGEDVGAAAVVPLAGGREIARARTVARVVETAARLAPWQSRCLARALTARVLLGAAGVPYALFLGVTRADDADLKAHAWVCTGPVSVTGGRPFGRFTVVGTFVAPAFARASGLVPQTLRADALPADPVRWADV